MPRLLPFIYVARLALQEEGVASPWTMSFFGGQGASLLGVPCTWHILHVQKHLSGVRLDTRKCSELKLDEAAAYTPPTPLPKGSIFNCLCKIGACEQLRTGDPSPTSEMQQLGQSRAPAY